MAYPPTADDVLSSLPQSTAGMGVTAAEATAEINRWVGRLEFQPTTAREESMAEAVVAEGAAGKLLKRQQLKDGFVETPAADSMIREANRMLGEYGDLRTTEADVAEAPVAYFDDAPF